MERRSGRAGGPPGAARPRGGARRHERVGRPSGARIPGGCRGPRLRGRGRRRDRASRGRGPARHRRDPGDPAAGQLQQHRARRRDPPRAGCGHGPHRRRGAAPDRCRRRLAPAAPPRSGRAASGAPRRRGLVLRGGGGRHRRRGVRGGAHHRAAGVGLRPGRRLARAPPKRDAGAAHRRRSRATDGVAGGHRLQRPVLRIRHVAWRPMPTPATGSSTWSPFRT